jgi:hypothetical protein
MRPIPYTSQAGRIFAARVIHIHGAKTREQLIALMPNGYNHKHNVARAVAGMLIDGQMVETDGVLSINADLDAYIADKIEAEKEFERKKAAVVQAAPPPVFRPLSSKYIPSACGTRDDTPAREYHPVGCGSILPPHRVGV